MEFLGFLGLFFAGAGIFWLATCRKVTHPFRPIPKGLSPFSNTAEWGGPIFAVIGLALLGFWIILTIVGVS
jgi:hypothetical protein